MIDSQEQKTSTEDAINRSRIFLKTKLKPDLEQATSLVSHLKDTRNRYLQFQEELIKSSSTLQEEKTSTLAHLGQGFHLPVEIESDSLYIVSCGLKKNQQDWQSDSGLYLQLNKKEALKFAEKKVDILKKRIIMAKERIALIQSHADLTTQSISQLEKLQADPSASLLDFLQT